MRDNQYIKDWSGESWYHSGYEHDSWYASPGKPENPAIITDESTHFVLTSDEADVEIKPIKDASIHGSQNLLITNHEKAIWAGVAQDGKWLEKGKNYTFSGNLKSIDKESSTVKIILFKTTEPKTQYFMKQRK